MYSTPRTQSEAMSLYVDERQVTRRMRRRPLGPSMGPRRGEMGGIWWPLALADVEEKGYATASFMGSLWEVRRRDMVMTGGRKERGGSRATEKRRMEWIATFSGEEWSGVLSIADSVAGRGGIEQ